MQILQRKLEFGKKKTAEVIYGACWHIGNPSTDNGGIKKFMERAKKQYWWLAGDIIEAITTTDKRFNHKEHTVSIETCKQQASSIIYPARNSCWGTICGNHEWGASREGDVAETIALNAHVPYLGACAYISVKCPNGKALIFTGHGKGSMGFNSGVPERDDVNRRLRLRRLLDGFKGEKDVSFAKCVAHYHRTIIDPARAMYGSTVESSEFKRRAITLREDWVMACPSLFRNYDDESPVSYAEMALYPPTDLGWLGIVFNRNGTIACVREYSPKGNITQEIVEDVIR